MPLPVPPFSHADEIEWALQFDMQERGRRLRELAEKTAGKELVQVKAGVWEYVRVHTNEDVAA